MNTEQIIREYLPNIIHMSLATTVNNKPWVCQVHFAYDNDLNLYFCSNITTRHCQEIVANPQVAGSISVQHGPGEKPRCIDFEGTAEKIEDITEDDPGLQVYETRFPGRTNLVEHLRQENGGRLYKITVNDYFLFDTKGPNPPGKHHLPWPQV
jgi:uncharacterized protein YhbP (UPF0306 family)